MTGALAGAWLECRGEHGFPVGLGQGCVALLRRLLERFGEGGQACRRGLACECDGLD